MIINVWLVSPFCLSIALSLADVVMEHCSLQQGQASVVRFILAIAELSATAAWLDKVLCVTETS